LLDNLIWSSVHVITVLATAIHWLSLLHHKCDIDSGSWWLYTCLLCILW